MKEILFVALLLAAWLTISGVAGMLWGNHCRQQGWREGFNEGFDEGYEFAGELRKEIAPCSNLS